MIHRKLKDPEGTKLCYTIYKIPRSPQLPNIYYSTGTNEGTVYKTCKHGTINRDSRFRTMHMM